MGRGFPGGKIKILPKRLNTIKEISWWHWPREGLGSLILGWITLASMGQPKFSLSWSAIVRLLFSRSRKEFGDSEPFGRWLLLDRVSVLTSLWTETNNRLQRKPVGSNSTHRASAISAETPSLAHQSSTGHEGGQREERAEGGAGRGRKCSGGWLQFIKKKPKKQKTKLQKTPGAADEASPWGVWNRWWRGDVQIQNCWLFFFGWSVSWAAWRLSPN